MKSFLRFYRWGINMKLHMSIYAIALLFFICISELLLGGSSIEILTIFEVVIVSFAVAIIESIGFPLDKDLSKKQLINHTIIWGICANLLFISSASIFNWFKGIPNWGYIVLLILLEGGLIAMWIGMRVIIQLDTKQLNRGLNKFQNK